MRLAAASTVAFVIGYGWFPTGGAECDRADCGWLQDLFYEMSFVGFVLLIAAVCGLIVAAIRGMVRVASAPQLGSSAFAYQPSKVARAGAPSALDGPAFANARTPLR